MEGYSENLKHRCGRYLGVRYGVAIVWSCFLLHTLLRPVSATLADDEKNVLLSIKKDWGNSIGLKSWSNTSDPCSVWDFVTCDDQGTTVIELQIFASYGSYGGYGGFGDYSDYNEITSPKLGKSSIPASISQLTNLQILRLPNLGLTGSIPPSVGNFKNLSILDLSDNYLEGKVPTSLWSMVSLQKLYLSVNNLEGSIPPTVSQLSNLSLLGLSDNYFSGLIPSELGQLKNLQSLDLSYNDLVGQIPQQVCNLPNLQFLILCANNLSGPIPPYWNVSGISYINLSDNKLDGSIPAALLSLESLSSIDLSHNFLSGTLQKIDLPNLFLMSLQGNNLSGIISDIRWSESLEYLDMSANNFTGRIPQFNLSTVPDLYWLNLSQNYLTGEIPENLTSISSLSLLAIQDNCLNGTLFLIYNQTSLTEFDHDSNCFNFTRDCSMRCPHLFPPKKEPVSIYITVGVVGGFLLAVTVVIVVVFVRHKRKAKSASSYKGPVRRYTLHEIRHGTQDFTTTIGEGGFATVYKAEFKDGTVAAVKRFNKRKPLENFEQEVEMLSHLNHRYLVNLIGYCDHNDELMLLFDFMDRGNLFENLHGWRAGVPLTWDDRVKIIMHVARGIEYLHYGTNPPTIHRDIKSANILLSDSDLDGSSHHSLVNAKLADFGLGKHTDVILEPYETMSMGFEFEVPQPPPTRVAGTPGYMDPEYLNSSFLSPKSDVYGYGVVLLELITGKQPVFIMNYEQESQERTSLVSWVQPYLDENEIWSIIDPKLQKGSFPEDQVVSVAAIAQLCIQAKSRDRPTIREVLKLLLEIFTGEASNSLTRDSFDTSEDEHIEPLLVSSASISSASYGYTRSVLLPRD